MSRNESNMPTNVRLGSLVTAATVTILLGTAACSSTPANGGAPSNPTSTQASGASPTTGAGGAASGATLPQDWPAELALPDKTTVIESTKSSATSMSVVARIDGDAKATFDTFKTQLTDAGYEIVASTFTPSDKGGFGSISARGTKRTVAIAFGPDPTGKTSQVTINVAQLAP